MEKITVHKAELLEKLQENRANHRAIFEEALGGYQAEAIKILERHIATLHAGKRRNVQIGMLVPEDHTSDYNRAIAMIEMSIDDTIVLSEKDFGQYVMDDWGWQRNFLSNTYGSTTAVEKFSDRYEVS